MQEQTLAIIKPDGVKHSIQIIEMIYKIGLRVIDFKVEQLSEEVLHEHYSHLIDKPFYPSLQEYMMSSEVVLMILEGENAIEKYRKLMGSTDSTKAAIDTIRGHFGTDIQRNVVHGSDSIEAAKEEIQRFFKCKRK